MSVCAYYINTKMSVKNKQFLCSGVYVGTSLKEDFLHCVWEDDLGIEREKKEYPDNKEIV